MRDEIELAGYVALTAFNLGGFLWWLRLWRSDGGLNVFFWVLSASFGVMVASAAVAISQGFYVFDRDHVSLAGRWLRPALAGSLWLAGLAQLWWSRTR